MLEHNPTGRATGPAHSRQSPARPTKRTLLSAGAAIVLLSAGLTVTVQSAESEVGLGTASSFAVLAATTITNSGATTITGDVGLDPGTEATGFDEVTLLDGSLHVDDTVAEQAKADLVIAYDDAAGRSPSTIGTELGGTTVGPGVYDSDAGTFGITGTLTLDADGDPNAYFIFQMASTLITAPNSTVSLINGADACNVFWQVGSSATLDTGSTFKGTIMALTSIEVLVGATIEGRLLARNGEVTMLDDTITRTECVADVPSGAPSGAPSGSGPTQAETDALPPRSGPSEVGTSLFALLVGLGAVALLLVRPTRAFKGGRRDG